jgi:peptidoglycan/xylan/chitin deacetylase (PgdA/CDA1 family)
MYHRVADLDPDPFRLCVPPGLFARQLDALGRSFRVLSVTDLLDRLAEDTLPPRAVALTFDDGYADARTAVDRIEALGMPATFFVNTEGLDAPRHESWEGLLEQLLLGTGRLPESFSLRRGETVIEAACATPEARRQLFDALHAHGYGLDAEGRADLVDQLRAWSGDAMTPRETHRVLNEGELRALAKRPGVEIGVHGAAHIALPLHAPSVQEHELRSARERLEGVLGIPVTSLAYAYGAHDERSVAIAARLGFRCSFSVSEAALLPWDDPLTLPRIDVGASDPQVLVARLEALL